MSSANLTRLEAEQRSAALELHAYHVDLDLTGAPDPQASGFRTTTTLTFRSTAQEIRLDFVGEAVTAVRLDGADLDPATLWDGSAIRLGGLAPHREHRVVVEAVGAWSRTGQGLHRFVDPLDDETYVYSHLEPADARRVFATVEQPDLKAAIVLHVTAPTGWSVLGNQQAVSQRPAGEAGEAVRTTFAPTPPLSTYLFAVCAGPWHHVQDTWTLHSATSTLEVPLGLWCRASLAEHLDSEELFAVTRAGLDRFHELFGFPYPWGKYDQLFAPEYNIGAMENPGCVTFNEKYLFTSRPTRQQLLARATTILHEMAHMWFGDLVTPAWWDDLWLKESFAEYMGTRVALEAAGHEDAWVAFAGSRKEWAYAADRLPTTHPIAADIPDLAAARQNFDGITYAKGAAVLKALVAYVGEEAFFAGSRLYFSRHAFGSARLVDLLDALEETSGRNLRAWAEQWLQTAGVDELTVEAADPERPALRRIRRTAPDDARRPHRLAVGLYLLEEDGRLARVRREEVDLTGDEAIVDLALDHGPAEEVWSQPHLVLPNDDDLSYAVTRLDRDSRGTALAAAGGMLDPLAQALVWSALWNDVREARLPASGYLRAVLEHGGRLDSRDDESATTLLPRLVSTTLTALSSYLPIDLRAPAWGDAFDGAWQRLVDAAPGSDQQLAWARTAVAFGARVGDEDVDSVATRLASLLEERSFPGLEGGPDLAWGARIALAALDRIDDAALDTALDRDPSAAARAHRLTARIARPATEAKAYAWEQLHADPPVWSNEQVDAAIEGFRLTGRLGLVARFAARYWDGLAGVWDVFPDEIAARLVVGLFPAVDEVEPTVPAADQGVPAAGHAWLAAHPDAPGALRRLVVEQVDAAERAVRAQQAVLAMLQGGRD